LPGPGQVALRVAAPPILNVIEMYLVISDVKYTDGRTDGKI